MASGACGCEHSLICTTDPALESERRPEEELILALQDLTSSFWHQAAYGPLLSQTGRISLFLGTAHLDSRPRRRSLSTTVIQV